MRNRLLFPLLLAAVAPAQSVLIRVQQDNSIGQVANGGTITVNAAAVNQPRTLTVTITYTGATSLRFAQAPQLLGSPDFSLSTPLSAASLGPSQSASLQLRFLPTSTRQAQAQLDLLFQEASVQTPVTLENPSPPPIPPTPGFIGFGLNGTVPDYALHYSFAEDGNIVQLPAGSVLPFVDTVTNNAVVATMLLANRGSGVGQILSATTTGEAFSLVSLPMMPASLPAGSNLPFQIRYRPRQPGTDSGTLTLTLEGGASYTVGLKGRNSGSYLTYELLPPDGTAQPVTPSQAVALPATLVGERTTVFIRMRNAGSLDIAVNAVAISGTGFQLSGLPFLPLTMPPGDVQLFSVLFTPAEAGRQTGRLRVGADTFELVGDGLGPRLSYSYRSPAGVVAVQPLGTIPLPGAQVGQSATVSFTLRNDGTTPAPIVSAAIVADGRSPFSLVALPALPAAIAPNASLTFDVRFSPFTSGLATASLRIGTEAFTLTGLGNHPEPLPDYTIDGPASVQAFAQPALSLTLATPYDLPVTGTLTLSAESDSFASDPSVLFASGGKVASFTIPAGSRKAVFANGATELKFQTGSVAGTILATPSFSAAGGQNLTPDAPRQYRTVLAPAAPRIAAVNLDARTNTGFTLQIVGHATTRTVTKMAVSFQGKSGFHFSGTALTQDLTATSFLWFNSPAAAAFGGQFVVQMPVTLRTSDTGTSAVPPIQALESITVSLTNERGTSESVTLPIL